VATSEATRDALERKQDQRRAAVNEAAHVVSDTDLPRIANALHAGIIEMVRAWRDDADVVEREMKRGWKSRMEFLRQCAAEAAGFAGGLTSPEFLRSLELVAETAKEDQTPRCSICKRALGNPEDEDSLDCGGDCLACIREAEAGMNSHAGADGSCPDYGSNVDPCRPECASGTCVAVKVLGEAGKDLKSDPIEQIRAFIAGPQIPGSFGPGDKPTGIKIGETVTADFGIPAFVDPPSAPKRMTWAEFAEASDALPDVDHASFSSITAIADCGVAYALGKILPETPAWWNVGGTAFHLAAEDWERQILDRPEDVAAILPGELPFILESGWARALSQSILSQEAETPDIPEHDWRIAGKGLEGYDWWRVNGADMLKRYVAYWAPKRAEGWKIYMMPDGRPALELELSLDVDGQRFDVIVDQVWRKPDGSPFIPDLKAGKSTPASTFQLGGAAWALVKTLPFGTKMPISGGFYMARQGSHDLEVPDLLRAHPWEEMRHKVRSFFAMRNAGAYLPRVSNFGGGCSSCGFKAICPARG
jgi:hypothetical protein